MYHFLSQKEVKTKEKDKLAAEAIQHQIQTAVVREKEVSFLVFHLRYNYYIVEPVVYNACVQFSVKWLCCHRKFTTISVVNIHDCTFDNSELSILTMYISFI